MSPLGMILFSFLALATLHSQETLGDPSANNGWVVRVKRKMIVGTDHRWPDNTVPYVIDKTLSAEVKARIKKAMEIWSKYTCITFRKRKRGERKVQFTISTTGSVAIWRYHVTDFSYSARLRLGQTVDLTGYPNMTTNPQLREVLHEIGHVLGFQHEHQRVDRDEWVNVLWTGVGYDKKPYSNAHGLPYDYRSIMHYKKKSGQGEFRILPKKKTYILLPKITYTVLPRKFTYGIPQLGKELYIGVLYDVNYKGDVVKKGKYRVKALNQTHVKITRKRGPITGFHWQKTGKKSRNRKKGKKADRILSYIRKHYRHIGELKGLSFLDVKLANHVYRCSARCRQKPCYKDGFLDKNCVCQCDSGKVVKPCSKLPKISTRAKCRPNVPHDDKDCQEWAAKGDCTNYYKKWMLEYCPGSCGKCGRRRSKMTCLGGKHKPNKITRVRPLSGKIERKPSSRLSMKCEYTTTAGGCGTYLFLKFKAPGDKVKDTAAAVIGPGQYVFWEPTYKRHSQLGVVYVMVHCNLVDRMKLKVKAYDKTSGHMVFTLNDLTLDDTGTYYCTYRLNSSIVEASVGVTVSNTASECVDTNTETQCGNWKKLYGCAGRFRKVCQRTCDKCDKNHALCVDQRSETLCDIDVDHTKCRAGKFPGCDNTCGRC